MKNIVVVANNRQEWRCFCETLQWTCSKQNHPYKQVSEAFHDLVNDNRYSVVYNNFSMGEKLRGNIFHDYVLLCHENHVDIGLLLSYIRGE